MPVFETKQDLVTFFKVLADNLDKRLSNSGFEVNLNIAAIDLTNTEAVMESFKACQRAAEKHIQPVKTVVNPMAKNKG